MDTVLYAMLKNKITEIRQKLLKVVEDASDMNSRIVQNTNNIEKKLDKNQGESNSGKITGINESGDIVPMFPQGVTYNEDTQCLEYGADEKLNLNAGIQLDDTLSKVGYAADAASVGELKGDLVEFRKTKNNIISDFFEIEQGGVAGWDGSDQNKTEYKARLRTKGTVVADDNIFVSCIDGYKFSVIFMKDDESGAIYETGFLTRGETVIINRGQHFRICFSNNPETWIAKIPSEHEHAINIRKWADSIGYINDNSIPIRAYQIGKSYENGKPIIYDKRCVTSQFLLMNGDTIDISANEGIVFKLSKWGSVGTTDFPSETGWVKEYKETLFKNQVVSILIKHENDSAFTDIEDLENFSATIYHKIFDEYLPKEYYGEKLEGKHGYISSYWLHTSYDGQGNSLQDIAFTDKYILGFINFMNVNGVIRVWDRKTKSHLRDVTSSVYFGHANNIAIGEKYNESDDIPLIYVESENENEQYRYRVLRLDNSWNVTLIKNYIFPSEIYGHNPQVTWDFENKLCYSIGLSVKDFDANTHCIFACSSFETCEEIQVSNGSFTGLKPLLLYNNDTKKYKYIQGSKFFNGKIYMAHSSSTDSTGKSDIFVLSPSNGSILSKIPVPFTGEVEGLEVYDEDRNIKIIVGSYFDFYKLEF